jgi:hypothetical protein
MIKQLSLESLLSDFDKVAQLRADTEALKPRLEKEIVDALDSGDALDEKNAQALQTKRGQLDLCSAKLGQIAFRLEKLTADIQSEFHSRYSAFNHAVRELASQEKGKWSAGNLLKFPKENQALVEMHFAKLYTLTSLAVRLSGLEHSIQFPLTQQDFVTAARRLLDAEKELPTVLAGLAKGSITLAEACTLALELKNKLV